jgi:hypothetical protein
MKNLIPAWKTVRVAGCGALVLALVVAAASALRAADQRSSASASSNLGRDLMGTWVHVGEADKVGEAPAKGGFIKLRTAHHWVAIVIDPRTGLVESTHGGTWQVKGNEYQETTEYGGEHHALIMNKTFKWQVTLEGDTMTKVGLDNTWHEAWKRVK